MGAEMARAGEENPGDKTGKEPAKEKMFTYY
jgi:hypothetical protein